MALRAPLVYCIPEETARLAHAAFPKAILTRFQQCCQSTARVFPSHPAFGAVLQHRWPTSGIFCLPLVGLRPLCNRGSRRESCARAIGRCPRR